MTRLEFINKLNKYYLTKNTEEIITCLNDLFYSKKYSEFLDLVLIAIEITQLYGFLSYLSKDELEHYQSISNLRSFTYTGNKLRYYNSGQLSLLKELESSNKSFISAPTSFGKTSIISEYIIDNKVSFSKIIFVVPTNSLLEELYSKFYRYNKEFKLNFFISTQITDNTISQDRSILFLTPEKFLILSEKDDLSEIDLIIMDEAYKIVDYGNKKISDFINSRSIRFRKVADIIANSQNKVIFLSPFTYENTLSMQKFLSKYNIKKINRQLEYVTHKILPAYDSYTFKKNIDNSKTGFTQSSSIARKTSMIIESLITEKNIVYVANYASSYDIIDEITSNPNSENNPAFLRYKKFLDHLRSNYEIDNYPKWKIIEALEKGIGIYISPMPRYIKKEITNLFEEGVLHSLIVTTSFTEGVNTSAKNLIFTSLINGPNTNKLAEIDILNVSGRAGRFSKSSIGKIICISQDVFRKVTELQDKTKVLLENYNYKQSSGDRIDYEIEMMDDEFLTDAEKEYKHKIELEIEELNLTKLDLNISLNVSNKWKLILYKKLISLKNEEVLNLANNIQDVISEDSSNRTKSIEVIFSFIRDSFNENDEQINPFPAEIYDIKPFSHKNNFTWGYLYKNYSRGSIKNIVKSNYDYITNIYKQNKADYPNINNKRSLTYAFQENDISWILRYYKSDLSINFNAFYSETFKFISNVIQYKIPFYLSFFISIFNLFIEKNNIKIENKLEAEQIVMFFEDGIIEKDYFDLIDFGVSHDLITKLKKNKISMSMIITKTFNNKTIDEYENLLLEDFIELNK